MHYRALLFDVMGTLVYEPFFREVPAALDMSLADLLEAKHPTAWVDFERGAIDEPTLRQRFFLDGRDYPHDRMKQAMTDAYAWLDGVEDILRELRDAGCELHLFSNYPDWYRIIEDKLAISRYAPWTFVSCHTGHRKPAAEAYLAAARALVADPPTLLFVDDREQNCVAARAIGMDAIRFEDAAQLRRELAARGIL